MTPPVPVTILRRLTEMVDPTICSMIAVSLVMREAISEGRFVSKKLGERWSRLDWVAVRRSATTRSPSHDTQ
jgi:DMSO/TMAO reductase YedYZ heme-binding membrane subunit